jgi:hypothetical protein
MEVQEILRELEFNKGHFPRAAIEAAIAQREAAVPHLIRFIEHAYENAAHLDDNAEETGDFMGHLYAMYLLAQFRERAAYPPIVKFFTLPGELSLDLTGDVVTEDLPNILASVCCGDMSLIKGMVENPELNEWVRGAAVRSFLSLVAAGEASREEAAAYYAELFQGKLERRFSEAWNSLVSCTGDLGAGELREEIHRAFDEGLAETFFSTPEEVEQDLARDKEQVLEHLQRSHYGLMGNALKEMEWWACFDEERASAGKAEAPAPPTPPLEAEDAGDESISPWEGKPVSPVRVERRPGRNDPCPCGSGKKYKHCCGRKPKEGT